MSEVRILIIEDEFIIADNLRLMLEDLGYWVFKPQASKVSALEFLQQEQPDLVLLDINLKGRYDGIDIGYYLHEQHIPFLYITSNADKETIDLAKPTFPKTYLIKPFTKEDIYAAIEMALQSNDEQFNVHTAAPTTPLLNQSLFIKTGTKYIKVNISDITLVEADGKGVLISTIHKQKLAVKNSLEHMLTALMQHDFIRVQRSFIINVNHLTAVNGDFVFIDQVSIPIGRQYKDELMSRLRTMS